ncbi:imelysin family protein [Albibacillus kandeliae]|uniref:imelysin family protein n=1 Tax=Albibacillus kandeliae TaxID=2174228 RepID=UPI000D68CF1D|nr:imelysin family protein [Albibacillus kandeliae]
MRIALPLCALLALAPPAMADVERALDETILPGFFSFATATEDLARDAQTGCTPEELSASYNAAYDAWMEVADLHMGPSETRALTIEFWPDTRGFTPKTLKGLIAAEDPVVDDPAAFNESSIAGRGFLALDMLLFDPDFAGYREGDYTCRLVQAVATDLAAQARLLNEEWSGTFAQTLRSAGEAGNATYLSKDEATRALYTQLVAGLEFIADTRLGRPLGTYDRPRPTRAEAYRSGRSLRNVVLALKADDALAHALADRPLPETEKAIAHALTSADRVTDPAFQDIDDPQSRIKVEVLQQAVRAVKDAVEIEIGVPMGITPGFNSQDGD